MKLYKNSHQTNKLHIKKGDTVKQISGVKSKKNENGEKIKANDTGVVLKVYPKTYRALVEGLNIITRHTKPNAQFPNGGRIQKEAPIHISNLMVMENGTPTRIGRKLNDNGKMQRYSKKSGEFIK